MGLLLNGLAIMLVTVFVVSIVFLIAFWSLIIVLCVLPEEKEKPK